MADSLGILSAMGIKDLGSWGATWVTVDEMIPVETEGITQAFSRLPDDSLTGSAGRYPSDQGVQVIEGPTNHVLDYNNFDTIFEMAFGTVSTRTFTLSDDVVAKYVGIEFDKQVSRYRYWAAKLGKIMLSGETDQHVKLNCEWVGRQIDRNATAFPLDETDLPGPRNKVRFEDLDFWIETIAGGPPTSSERILVSSFELEIDKVFVKDDYASKTGVAGEEKFPLEPVPNEKRACKLKVGIPRYDADTFQDWKDADTPLQVKMTFTRSGETLVLDLPDLRIIDGADAPITGPERIQDEINFDVYKPETGNPLYDGNEVQAEFT